MVNAKSVYEVCRLAAVIGGLITAVIAAIGYIAYNVVERGRRLNQHQTAWLTEKLRFVSKPAYAVTIMRPIGDDEAMDVGDAVKKSLDDAGFKTDGVWPDNITGSDPVGILVRRNPKDDLTANALVDAFNSVKLSAKIIPLEEPRPLDIVVGRKPPY